MEQKSLTKFLTLHEYYEICSVLDNLPLPSVCYRRENQLRSLYPHILLDTIASIIQHHYQQQVKKCHFVLRNKGDTIYYKFLRGLQQQKTKVAFNLSLEIRQPPYLVSQVLLQKHFSKQWEDEKTQNVVSDKGNTPTKSNKNNKLKKEDSEEPVPHNIKRITPVQVDCKQEFPSLKETNVKQRRVTPTAVRQNSPKPSTSNSTMIQYDNKHIHPRTSLASTSLSLCDVMVIKTKKSKKNSQSVKNKLLSYPNNTNSNTCVETRNRVMENLIQDKEKNKLFDRILNKSKSKEFDVVDCLTKDIKNNNVIIESHLTPKKVKFTAKQENTNLMKDESIQNPSITELTGEKSCCNSNTSFNVTRVTPQRIVEQPQRNTDHQLSSIHFMTQNCQSKDELYEDYRHKLERLSERFTKQLTCDSKLPSVSGESKEKIEKLAERMKKKTVSRIYLNSLEESERKKAEAALLTKIEQDGKDVKEDNKPREVLLTPEDLEAWKRILWNHHKDLPSLVVQVTDFWKKFSKNGKAINGPRDLLKRMLREPTIINDPILSKEIAYNNAMDDQYGPVADLYNRSLGVLYEDKLTSYLDQCGIAYKSEKLCMSLGFDKTPDVLVYPTLYIAGKPVNWIESKAVFGNPQNHELYQKNQYSPYFERFGPGCVIYWFGHVDSIAPLPNQYIVLTDHPARDLMEQPAAGDIDPVTFLQRCSSVITVESMEIRLNPSKAEEQQSPSIPNQVRMRESPSKVEPSAKLNSPPCSQERKERGQASPSYVSPCANLSSQFSARVNFSESPLPKCLFKSPSDKSDGNVAFSTPLKPSGSSHKDALLAIKDTFDIGLESPEELASEAMPRVHKSSLDCSSVSMCSMCDHSLADPSDCSSLRCTKLPACFSSHCSDKLLSFTLPCSCGMKGDNTMLPVLNTIGEYEI